MNAPIRPVNTAPPAEASALFQQPLPFELGDYFVVRKIGQGGMGAVFLARQALAGDDARLVVLKTLRQHHNDAEYTRRFFDEARVVVRLAHPAICRVFEVGEVAGRLYLAMEHILGVDLTTVLHAAHQRGVKVPLAVGVALVGQLLDALDYAHHAADPSTGEALGLVHRDVSPHNVMVGFDGQTWLIDFGLATSVLKRERTATNVVMGKLAYMAPEHARGQPVDARADQYAAAQTLYEVLTGERFYGAMKHREIWQLAGRGYLPPGLDTLPDDVAAVLKRALSPQPALRFPTCGALREALWACASTHDGQASTAGFLEQVLPGERARRQAAARQALATLPPSALMSAPTVRSSPAPGSTDDDLSTTGALAPALTPGTDDATVVSAAPAGLDSEMATQSQATVPAVERTVVVRRSEATALIVPARPFPTRPAQSAARHRSAAPLIAAGVSAGLAVIAVLLVVLRSLAPTSAAVAPSQAPPPSVTTDRVESASASLPPEAPPVTSTGGAAARAPSTPPPSTPPPSGPPMRESVAPGRTPPALAAPTKTSDAVPRAKPRRPRRGRMADLGGRAKLPPAPGPEAAPAALIAYLSAHCTDVPCAARRGDILKRFMTQALTVEQASARLRSCIRTCRR